MAASMALRQLEDPGSESEPRGTGAEAKSLSLKLYRRNLVRSASRAICSLQNRFLLLH